MISMSCLLAISLAATRLTTPCAVPTAIGGASASGTRATTCSPPLEPEVLIGARPGAELHRVAGHRGQVDGGEAHQAAEVRHGADVAAGRRVDRRADRVVLRAACRGRRRRQSGASAAELGTDHASGGREEDATRCVRDLQVGGAPRAARERGCTGPPFSSSVRRGVPNASAAASSSCATCARSSTSLPRSSSSSAISALQVVALGLELDAGELREPAQPQLEDVLGLRLGQVEDAHQARARLLAVVGGADDLDDLVDVEDRDEQALDEVQALLAAREAVAAAPGDDLMRWSR